MNIALTPERIGALAQTMGISAVDLAAIISRGASHSYQAGDYLYHESTPRLWMGIVEEGEIEIVRGLAWQFRAARHPNTRYRIQ